MAYPGGMDGFMRDRAVAADRADSNEGGNGMAWTYTYTDAEGYRRTGTADTFDGLDTITTRGIDRYGWTQVSWWEAQDGNRGDALCACGHRRDSHDLAYGTDGDSWCYGCEGNLESEDPVTPGHTYDFVEAWDSDVS